MELEHRATPEDKISLRELIERARNLLDYVFDNWKVVGLCVVLGGILGFLYTLRKPTYVAETTFALEESSKLDQLSGLATSVGIDVGALGGDEENLFKGENILELYKSKKMLIEALLTEADYQGKPEKLIYPFARELKWDQKWESKPYLRGINFDIPREQFTHRHDSILLEAVEELKDSYVEVEKPSRRLNIISVKVRFKDAIFARIFDAELVRVVNDFYYHSKTRKSQETVETFQHQADSIRASVNNSMIGIASTMEFAPNLNSLYKTKTVPLQQKQIDLQISLAAYGEIIKSLELAKLSLRDKQPLIQIIDKPLNYLENNKWKWYKGLVIGAFLGGVLSCLFFLFKFLSKSALRDEQTPAH
ncbi:MAG: exopolysaccharide biosynthesis protein [Imperialibacter sp.]|uniref:exopolysaccharide biosynthesis protein n=1 Tax=Imperialibacter sp. TaxID=2038411 RepID=UPI0032EED9CA